MSDAGSGPASPILPGEEQVQLTSEQQAVADQEKVEEMVHKMMKTRHVDYEKVFGVLESNEDLPNSTVDFAYSDLSTALITKLVYAAEDNPPIRKLHLHDCSLNQEKCLALYEMFDRGLSGIEEVWLSNNQLGDEGFGAVGEALAKNPNVKRLYLANVDAGSDGAVTFSGLMGRNTCLQRLSLSQNHLGSGEGWIAMWDMIEENQNCELTHLYFSNTHMDDAGLQKMMSRFEMMPKLEYLELHHNKISDAVAKELYAAVVEIRKEGRPFIVLLDNGNDKITKAVKKSFGGRTGSYFEDDTDSEDEDRPTRDTPEPSAE